MAKNEPQSYGSQQEWLTGETGQKVNPSEGGPDNDASADDAQGPVQKVTAEESGAKRESYFKDRDYKS
jgi:hypothetical protein